MISARYLTGCAAFAVAAMVVASPASAIDPARLQAADKTPNDWLTYHGSYKSYHYSALDQINADNVKNLRVAWTHMPGRSTRGLQSMPLVADGVLYYSGSYSRVFALDGATGKLVWSYFPELDEELVAMQTHSPYNRGIALGDGKVFVGTVDGRLIALDMKTGKQVWDTKLVDSQEAHGRLHRRAAGGQGHGHHRQPGRRVDLARPDLRRRRQDRPEEVGILHRRRHRGAPRRPGATNPGAPAVAAAGCPAATTPRPTPSGGAPANPAPLYDWAGADWKTRGPAAGHQSLHEFGHRARSRYRQAEVLSPGAAARRLGLRLRRSASS